MAAIPCSRRRVWLGFSDGFGKGLERLANGDSLGCFVAIPSACSATLSRIKRGGINLSAMPFFIWMTVWSSKRGICFRREM